MVETNNNKLNALGSEILEMTKAVYEMAYEQEIANGRTPEEAERIAKQNGKKELLVLSGVGVRGYYRKLGYVSDKAYMAKQL